MHSCALDVGIFDPMFRYSLVWQYRNLLFEVYSYLKSFLFPVLGYIFGEYLDPVPIWKGYFQSAYRSFWYKKFEMRLSLYDCLEQSRNSYFQGA